MVSFGATCSLPRRFFSVLTEAGLTLSGSNLVAFPWVTKT